MLLSTALHFLGKSLDHWKSLRTISDDKLTWTWLLRLQACCPWIQVLTWSSTVVPCWWTLPVGGSQPTTSPSFSAILITGRPPYASVNHRRQSFSCRLRTRVERSAAARNIHILSIYFSQTSEDSSLSALLPLTVCVVPEQWLIIFGHANRLCYLLHLIRLHHTHVRLTALMTSLSRNYTNALLCRIQTVAKHV